MAHQEAITLKNQEKFDSEQTSFHGVTPKHLQSYLDEFCFRTNRRNFQGQLFNRLLSACTSTEHLTS